MRDEELKLALGEFNFHKAGLMQIERRYNFPATPDIGPTFSTLHTDEMQNE